MQCTVSQNSWIMSHVSTVIQRVIGGGDDDIKKEGSPNDKLRTCTEPVTFVKHWPDLGDGEGHT